MSLLDDDLFIEDNRFKPIDLDDIDKVYDSWRETEDTTMRLRRRGEIRDKMIKSIGKLNNDIQKVNECSEKYNNYVKLKKQENNNCYFWGLKIIAITGVNLCLYYYFFC